MYKINVVSSFSGAHHLSGYDGECKNLHGHNWKVRVQLIVKEVDSIGMGIDFKVVKKHLSALIDSFDHKYLNDLEYFKDKNPTSENIAKVIYEELQKSFVNTAKVSEVEIWESEFSSVIYTKVEG